MPVFFSQTTVRAPAPWTWAAVACVAAVAAAGCSRSEKGRLVAEPEAPAAQATTAEARQSAQPETAFEPPPLEALDRDAKWIDRPVKDALAVLREQQSKEPVLGTVAEALTLKNDSSQANATILSALGRLPEKGEADLEARIDRHVAGDLGSTNPILISSSAEFDILGLTGFGLFSYDRTLEPFANAETAVSWQTSADGLYDKVVMRDDVVWSDGKPITAHDIAFTYRVIMDPRVPVPAVRTGTDQMKGVHAYDDRTVVFFHKEPLATNVWNINFPVLPRHVYEGTWEKDPTLKDSPEHVALEEKPVSGGPYEILSRKRGQEIVLRRRESWSQVNSRTVREQPYFKDIRFRIIEDPNTALLALKSGEIDEMILQPEQWTTQTVDDDYYQLNTKATAPEWVSFHFAWNIGTPFFADRRVRRAMSYAFDHDRMLEKICLGLYEPCGGNFDEAGWTDHDNDGIRDKEIDGQIVPFEFALLVNQQPFRIAICTLLKENLEQIGVIANVRPVEVTAMQEMMQKKNFQACFSGWGSGTDPDTSENIWKTGEMRNYCGYSNPEVDRLFAEGRRELDRSRRAEKYARIQEILYDDQPYTWLFWRNSFYGFSKRLRGYAFSPRGPYHYSPGSGSLWKPRAE